MPADSGSASDLLVAYTRLFDAIELDSVFYRPPGDETIGRWKAATGEDFTFAVRIPREVTHVDRLGLPERLEHFVSTLEPLGDRLGCLLFTTPPTFDCDLGRFAAVLDVIPDHIRTAWEFRHPSWLSCPEVLDLLAQANSTPVIVDTFEGTTGTELLPGGEYHDRWRFPFTYVRFRRDRYSVGELTAWGESLGPLADQHDVYAFYRQSFEAPSYATALLELLAEAQEPARVGGRPAT